MVNDPYGRPFRAEPTGEDPGIATTRTEAQGVRTDAGELTRAGDPVFPFVVLLGLALALGWIGVSLEINVGS